MISSFHIRNFKSYRDATLPLAPLTLLIGANASGKSNAIEAIRLLSLLAQGRRLPEIRSELQSSDQVIRGNAATFGRLEDVPLGVGCEIDNAEWCRLEVELRFERDWSEIHDEAVFSENQRQLYGTYAEGEGATRHMEVAEIDISGSAPFFVPVTDQQAIFTQLNSPAAFPPGSMAQRVIPDVVGQFRENLERIRFYDPEPRKMRGYSYLAEGALNEDGSNISGVLFRICKSLQTYQQVLGFVSELPEQQVLGLGFVETGRDDVMLYLVERSGQVSREVDAAVLSDGTLRVLGIAAALLAAEPGSTLIIEELDNGIHPSRAEVLLQKIDRIAKERELHVLLTTHNPALLDRLPIDAIPRVVCAYRDPHEGDSRLVRLSDLPSYPELVARGPLGQLMTRGVLNYFLKHQESDEVRKERSLRWIDALKAQVRDV
jgi:predicted ATPase